MGISLVFADAPFLKITYLSGGLFLYMAGQVAPGVIRSTLPGSEQEPEECDATKLIVALQFGT
jgi:hypothetical protein